MKRREFITLLGGTAVAWPLGARAQKGERMRRIGVLMHLAADDPESPTRIAALRQGLQQFGWADGGNLRIDYRWAKGQADLFRQGAKELVQLAPDVLVASTSLAVPALQEATRTLPIVFIKPFSLRSGSRRVLVHIPYVPYRTSAEESAGLCSNSDGTRSSRSPQGQQPVASSEPAEVIGCLGKLH